jgi:hypothetical protein
MNEQEEDQVERAIEYLSADIARMLDERAMETELLIQFDDWLRLTCDRANAEGATVATERLCEAREYLRTLFSNRIGGSDE